MPSLSCLNGNTFWLEKERGNLTTRGRGGKWCVWGVNKKVSQVHSLLTSCRWNDRTVSTGQLGARYCYWLPFILCIHQLPLKAIVTSGPAIIGDGLTRTLMAFSDRFQLWPEYFGLDYWQHANIFKKYNTYEATVTRGQTCKCYRQTRPGNGITYL